MIIVATYWIPCLFHLHAMQNTHHFNMIIKRTYRDKAERLWLPQNALRRLHQCYDNPYHGFTK
jgi:hypothetical protein